MDGSHSLLFRSDSSLALRCRKGAIHPIIRSPAERAGSLEVDEQVKLGRLLDWQVGGLGPLENPSGVDAGLAIGIRQASSVTDETARLREVNKRVDARDSIARGQGHDLGASSDEESISTDHDRVSASLSQARESCIDFV